MSLFARVKKKSVLMLMAMIALIAALPAAAGAAEPSSEAIDFSESSGFGVGIGDVVETGWSFVGMFNQYTMLVLAVLIAPVFVGFIIWLWRKLPKFGGGKA